MKELVDLEEQIVLHRGNQLPDQVTEAGQE